MWRRGLVLWVDVPRFNEKELEDFNDGLFHPSDRKALEKQRGKYRK